MTITADEFFGKDLKVYDTKMTETIQQLKEDIAVLQEKLQKLEEKEPDMMLLRQGKVDFVDYDGKDGKKYIRIEYTDSFADDYIWYVRRVGEDAIRPVRDVNVYAPLEELYQKEVVKQKDDYPYKKYTPEETEQSLKEAFREAIKEGIIPEIKQPTDELIEKLVKKPPEFLKFELGQSLTDLIYDWWEDVFTTHSNWDMETSIDYLVDRIDKQFIPPSHDTNGYEWEKCLKMMRDNLR